MSQLYRRIQRLESHIGLGSRGSLGALFQELERMERDTSVLFDDAVMELVKGLDDQELNSIIADAQYRFGREIPCKDHGKTETGTILHSRNRVSRDNQRHEIDASQVVINI